MYYGRCANGEWNPVPFVRSSCYCGCGREGSDIKGDRKVFYFIICHWGKKKLKWHLKHDNFIFCHLCCSHVRKNNDKPSPVSVGLKLCLLFSVISTHKPLFLAPYCLPLLYAQNDSFLPNLFISSYHPRSKINT